MKYSHFLKLNYNMIFNQLLQFIVADDGKRGFGDSGVVVVLPNQDNFLFLNNFNYCKFFCRYN